MKQRLQIHGFRNKYSSIDREIHWYASIPHPTPRLAMYFHRGVHELAFSHPSLFNTPEEVEAAVIAAGHEVDPKGRMVDGVLRQFQAAKAQK